MSAPDPNPWSPKGELGSDWTDDPWTSLNSDAKLIGDRVWNNFTTVYKNKEESSYIKLASEKWGVPANRWRISLYNELKVYSSIYGYIYITATKKEIRPEFLHAIVFGEGLEQFILQRKELGLTHTLEPSINSFDHLGLDFIGERLDMLILEGYLDEKYRDKFYQPEHMKDDTNELGEKVYGGLIIGFEAAVAMVAAELLYAGNIMMTKARERGIIVTTQIEKEFLMYSKYVSKSNALKDLTTTDALQKNCSSWDKTSDGEWPAIDDYKHPKYYRFQTLKRLASAEWYELAQIYSA